MSKDVKAIFAGTFDPITNGHIDIIERAAKMFEHLQVGLLINPNKNTLFSMEERMDLIKESIKHLDNDALPISRALHYVKYILLFEK